MATDIYKIDTIDLVDGTKIEISPLKIKYLREFMNTFEQIKDKNSEDEILDILIEGARICMKQHYPLISKSTQDIEDNLDIETMKKVLNVCAGVNIGGKDEEEETIKKSGNNSGQTWEQLDLAKIEAEVFLIGRWKNFDELESSISMPELIHILSNKRELDYEEKKFLAGIQGVDLEKNSNKGQKEWEDMKARVFSKGQATDSNDIVSLQGNNAQKAGFGIGLGLEYENLT